MTAPARRVAVTGVGAISALGHDAPQMWAALCDGRSGIARIESVDVSDLRFQNGAEVKGLDPAEHFDPARLDLLDRFAQFALIAAREAVRDFGVELDAGAARAHCRLHRIEPGRPDHAGRGLRRALSAEIRPRTSPLDSPKRMANAGASQISMEFGLTGPCCTISTACSSANHAIGQAFWMVRGGVVDLAITGGSEAPFSPGHLKAWEAMRVVSPDTCRPFSLDRRGLILGEGGAMLVLEPLEAARARGARIYAEIAGFGMSSRRPPRDAADRRRAGARHARRARRRGALAEQIGYINAHGTGTRGNDSAEVRAIREVFGAHADHLAVSSTKSMHGHALGAAGALEAVATVLALENGILPPTANFTAPDPECDLDVVPGRARAARPEAALSNSFAFGGLNAVLAFRAT